jgi:hypothetical protein
MEQVKHMVFVTRKPGESLILETPGGKVVVQVLSDNQLGIDAPPDIRIVGPTKAEPLNWLPARPKLVRVA